MERVLRHLTPAEACAVFANTAIERPDPRRRMLGYMHRMAIDRDSIAVWAHRYGWYARERCDHA